MRFDLLDCLFDLRLIRVCGSDSVIVLCLQIYSNIFNMRFDLLDHVYLT